MGTLNGLYISEGQPPNPEKFTELLSAREVRALYKSESGTIWIGTANGLYSLTDYFRVQKYLDLGVRSIQQAFSGKILLGTYGHGIIEFDERTNNDRNLIDSRVLPEVRQLIKWRNYIASISDRRLFFY